MADKEVRQRIKDRAAALQAQGVPAKRAKQIAQAHIEHEDDVEGTLDVVEVEEPRT